MVNILGDDAGGVGRDVISKLLIVAEPVWRRGGGLLVYVRHEVDSTYLISHCPLLAHEVIEVVA